MTADRAKELQMLVIWTEFTEELDKVIAAETGKLMSCTPDGLNKIQERVMALRFVKEFPRHIVERES
jgi:hypothetical protein